MTTESNERLLQTNYLDLARFKTFIDIIPKLEQFHLNFQKPPMDAEHFQMLYKIAYRSTQQ